MNSNMSQAAMNAVFNCVYFRSSDASDASDTQVRVTAKDAIGHDTYAELYVDGELVLVHDTIDKAITLHLGTHVSRKAKARINAVLSQVDGRVYTRNGKHFLSWRDERYTVTPGYSFTISL